MRHRGAILIAALAAAILVMAGCGGGREAGLRDQAHKALAAGDPAEAGDLLRQAIDGDLMDPDLAAAYNDLGVIQQRLGQPEDAVRAFENSRRLDPLLPGSTYNLGVLSHQRGDMTRAAEEFQAAARLDPLDPRPLEYLAAIEMSADRWEEAEELLRQALDLAPDSARARGAIGVALLHTRGASEAMTSLLEAVERESPHAASYFNLAVIHRDWLDDPNGASRYMNQYLKTSPEDTQAMVAMDFLDAAPATHAQDSAAAATDPGIGAGDDRDRPREPRPAPDRPTPRPGTVEGLVALARRQAAQGDTALAYRTCREAHDLAGRRGDAPAAERVLVSAVSLCRDQAGAHYDYGLHLMKREQYAAALRSFKQAVGLAPQSVPAYLGMAASALRSGQDDSAQIALERVLRIDPGNREATWGLAGLYDQRMNRPEDAIAAYRDFLTRHGDDSRAPTARARIAALRQLRTNSGESPPPSDETPPDLDPTAAEPSATPAPEPTTAGGRPPASRVRNRQAAVEAYNRGTMYQARKDWEQAIFFYTRALEQDSTFHLAYYNLGKIHQTQAQPARAIEAYEASVRLQPRHVNSRFNLALLYREKGRNDLAVSQLRTLLQVEPDNARSHYLLGLIYSENPDTRQQAATHFRRFLQLNPNDQAASAVRQWLAGVPAAP